MLAERQSPQCACNVGMATDVADHTVEGPSRVSPIRFKTIGYSDFNRSLASQQSTRLPLMAAILETGRNVMT